MLHLFYVYSGIVARMVTRIIGHLGLAAEDVVIVTDRSQKTLPIKRSSDKSKLAPYPN